MNPKQTRQAVKLWLSTYLSDAMPTPLTRVDSALFDPTKSGKNECFLRFGAVSFDETHALQDLDLFLAVWKGDEDDWIGALSDFFGANITLGGSVILAELQAIEPLRDLAREDFLFLQVQLTLTGDASALSGEAPPLAPPVGPGAGVGIPPDGLMGQVLGKLSDTSFDVGWIPQSGGGGSGVDFVQASALAVWTIAHNLGHYPVVSLYTPGGLLMTGDVLNLSVNVAQVSFAAPTAGRVRLV